MCVTFTIVCPPINEKTLFQTKYYKEKYLKIIKNTVEFQLSESIETRPHPDNRNKPKNDIF